MPEEEKKISKFSSGLNILMRVDILWKNCHNFKRMGRYYQWNEELDSVWLELARDLKPEEYYDIDENKNIIKETNEKKVNVFKVGFKTQFDSFEQKMQELLPILDKGNGGFKTPNEKDIEKRAKQYRLLMEKQLFLARLENELGKGTSWEDEDDDF